MSDPPWEWHIQETFKAIIPLSIEALKILALVNGGAAVAIISFCGNLASHCSSPEGSFVGGHERGFDHWLRGNPESASAYQRVRSRCLFTGGRVFRGERECDFNDSGERF